jgi:hypothetical protein
VLGWAACGRACSLAYGFARLCTWLGGACSARERSVESSLWRTSSAKRSSNACMLDAVSSCLSCGCHASHLSPFVQEAEARKEDDGVRAEKRERAKAAAQAMKREAGGGTAGAGSGVASTGGGDAGIDVRASLQAALLAKLRADMTGAGRS